MIGLAAVFGFLVLNVVVISAVCWRREKPTSLREFLGL